MSSRTSHLGELSLHPLRELGINLLHAGLEEGKGLLRAFDVGGEIDEVDMAVGLFLAA